MWLFRWYGCLQDNDGIYARKIQEMQKEGKVRLILDIRDLRNHDPEMTQQ